MAHRPSGLWFSDLLPSNTKSRPLPRVLSKYMLCCQALGSSFPPLVGPFTTASPIGDPEQEFLGSCVYMELCLVLGTQ